MDDTAKLRDSLLIDDNRWVEYVEEKLRKKTLKYNRCKKAGICLILLFVSAQTLISSQLDQDWFKDNNQFRVVWFCVNLALFACLLVLMILAIVLLVIATRTMDKLAEQSNTAHQSMGIRTVNLNLIAAILQFVAFIVWSGGQTTVRYLYRKKTIDLVTKQCTTMILSTISSVVLLLSFYVLIHVFWHYGINIEHTLEKREKLEEEKRRKAVEKAIKVELCEEFPDLEKLQENQEPDVTRRVSSANRRVS